MSIKISKISYSSFRFKTVPLKNMVWRDVRRKLLLEGGLILHEWGGGGGGNNFKKEGLDKNRISLKVTSSKNYNF